MPKETIFSQNELEFLKNPENKKFNKNYVYNLRFTIKNKIENFFFNDLPLLIKIKKKNERKKVVKSTFKPKNSLISKDLIEKVILSLMKEYPQVITSILKMEEINEYLGEDFLAEYFSLLS